MSSWATAAAWAWSEDSGSAPAGREAATTPREVEATSVARSTAEILRRRCTLAVRSAIGENRARNTMDEPF